MRIASLLPSATEIVCALGLEEDLVAITHECDHPAVPLKGKPVITSSVLKPGLSSREVDTHIRRLLHEGSSIYDLDAQALDSLNPDLILTQELCEVCAVSYPLVEAAARRSGAGGAQLVSLEPESIDDVFHHILLVGRLTGKEAQAVSLVERLRRRMQAVVDRLTGRDRPSVVFLEWVDPLFSCGHWTPELVGLSGGRELLGLPRQPARTLAWEELLQADPEVIVIAPCGLSLERSLKEAEPLTRRQGWESLKAVSNRSVYVVDGNAYFSRPGPRLVDSVEILAGLLQPEICQPPPTEVATRLSAAVEKAGSGRHD